MLRVGSQESVLSPQSSQGFTDKLENCYSKNEPPTSPMIFDTQKFRQPLSSAGCWEAETGPSEELSLEKEAHTLALQSLQDLAGRAP